MGTGSSSLSLSLPTNTTFCSSPTLSTYNSKSKSLFTPKSTHLKMPTTGIFNPPSISASISASFSPLKSGSVEFSATHSGGSTSEPISGVQSINPDLLQELVYDALVWGSLHGLVVGDKSVQNSGKVPGVGMVHAPFALLPTSFPERYWRQACELTPIFNELIDRVSLDGDFLQESLSRTKKVDAFTSRLVDIHLKMLKINKKEEIRLGLHRSDYMLDDQTKALLQIELNTISSSFTGLGCLVTELHRYLLKHYGTHLGLHSEIVPENTAVSWFAEALAQAWKEYNNSRAVIVVVVQTEERNMYDQHWLSMVLKERHGVTTLRKTLAEIDAEGRLLPDGTLVIGSQPVAVVYFRAGYAPTDYPSESEWRARLLMEQSSAVKCPCISYHLAGTKKIQQELAKPNILERFLKNEEDILKLRKCFAGLWSLDNSEIVEDAINRPELYVLKPQREGGGNNIYGNDLRETLQKLQEESDELAAYILMQRIFPISSPAFLVREGICHQDHAISELGMYGTYLRNKDKVIINNQCGYLMRTKVSSSNEGGVAAGFAVLDSMYLS